MAIHFIGRSNIPQGRFILNPVTNILFVNSTTNGSVGSQVTTFDFLKPEGVQTGDLLIGILHWGNDAITGQGARTYPEGFTEEFQASDPVSNFAHFNTLISWKIATASEPSNYSVSWTTAGGVTLDMLVFRNVDQTTPFEKDSTIVQGAGGNPINLTGLSIEFSGSVIIAAMTLVSRSSENTVTDYPENMIENNIGSDHSLPTNAEYAFWSGYEPLISAGPTGTKSWTVNAIPVSNPGMAAIMCALKPEDTAAPGPEFDAFWDNVVLLAGFDGTDGATAYDDESSSAHGAFTFDDNAQLDTAEKKFGTASLLLDGTTDRLTLDDSGDWTPGAFEPYTWEAWVYPLSSGSATRIASHYRATSSQRSWAFARDASNKLTFACYSNGTTLADSIVGNDDIVQDEWSHVAVTRDVLGNIRGFVNGVLQSDVGSYSGAFHNSTTILRIGNIESGGEIQYWHGYMDEIRFTKGIARYTETFTPPTAAFPRQGPS